MDGAYIALENRFGRGGRCNEAMELAVEPHGSAVSTGVYVLDGCGLDDLIRPGALVDVVGRSSTKASTCYRSARAVLFR